MDKPLPQRSWKSRCLWERQIGTLDLLISQLDNALKRRNSFRRWAGHHVLNCPRIIPRSTRVDRL